MEYRTIILVDGENLRLRYEAMLGQGYVEKRGAGVIHTPGLFLWSSGLTLWQQQEIVRVSYFTTIVGDDDAVSSLEDRISKTNYVFVPRDGAGQRSAFLCPRVFKKTKKGFSNKSADINITIDALRHAYNRSVDRIAILSGDGDFEPVVREVMRHGVQVIVGAFSNGLNPILPRVADGFLDLDRRFVERATA